MAYDPDNIFAKILREEMPAYRVYEDECTVAFLDVMPQADGHTLVLPRVAAENLFQLDETTMAALMRTTRHVAAGVLAAFEADGIRLMQLNGPAAGQTVFHFHMHIIPCHEGRELRRHVTQMADGELLAGQAERLRNALTTIDN